ncbi:MAG: hypothetical protein EA400_10290 [Chromatiaceae bacterium]|nr:MAG: hypothetical protein EA400_10290 [Chromatiaceae bacterium]
MYETAFTDRLRQLIGRQCQFYGRPCRIVDVLASERRLVLEARDALPPIQTNQYGQPTWRSYEHIEIRLDGADGDGLSEELLHLLDGLSSAHPAG